MTSPAPLWTEERITERARYVWEIAGLDQMNCMYAAAKEMRGDYEAERAASAQREAALLARVAELEARNEKLGRLQQDAGWECADCEMNLDAIRALLESEAPVYSSLGRWLYGGNGLDSMEDNGNE